MLSCRAVHAVRPLQFLSHISKNIGQILFKFTQSEPQVVGSFLPI